MSRAAAPVLALAASATAAACYLSPSFYAKVQSLLASAKTTLLNTSADGSFSWKGFERSLITGLARPLLVARGSKGYAACGYVDVAAADKFGEACIIFSGVSTCDDFLASDVKKVSEKASALGITVGQKGAEAIELLR